LISPRRHRAEVFRGGDGIEFRRRALFNSRVKPLSAILETAENSSLRRSLNLFQLIMLGVGGVIGTGIFVLTAEAAQKAGPGMIVSFAIAGIVCAVAALCYAELAAMVPISGSAYTYTYAVMGELLAWLVGWALVLEYAISASAVSVGWSGYFVGEVRGWFGIELPRELTAGPVAGGVINLPAAGIALIVTVLLTIGTKESAWVNVVLVTLKLAALTIFIVLAVPIMQKEHFEPFFPEGWTGSHGAGVLGAAASIFFAYIGFDAVSTAAEETNNPQRNIPLGLIGSLTICTAVYIAVAAGAIGGPLGAQPLLSGQGAWLSPGSAELAARCADLGHQPLVCSSEALAHVLRAMGYLQFGNLIGMAAFLALPSVILVLLYGQTRIFFAMARDGLLPERLALVHQKWNTPHLITMVTGIAVTLTAAFLPIGKLADIANAGTLFAFSVVSVSVAVLRRRHPLRVRPFRAPALWLVAPVSVAGCIGLYTMLPIEAQLVLPCWSAIGLSIYFSFGYWNSYVGRRT
jgi:APA family basic amino acid/polyamine antiporter